MSKLTPNDNLLKAIATLIQSNNQNEIENLLNNLNLTELYYRAIEHGVTSLIWTNLTSIKFPKNNVHSLKFFKNLKDFKENYTIANNFIDTEALKVLRIFASNNIKVIVLKGFSLSHHVYSMPCFRPKSDIDILITDMDSEKVKTIFKSNSYTNPRGWEPKTIINQFSQRKYISKNLNVDFDIHLKISNNKHIENILYYKEILKSSDTTTINNVYLISKPYAFTHACLHLLNHKSSKDMIKLIWYYDIFKIIEQLSKKEQLELIQIIKNKGLAKIVLYALNLTSRYFPSIKINNLTIKLEKCKFDISLNFLLIETSQLTIFWRTIAETKGIRNKIEFIRETVFPPKVEIYNKYGTDTGWPLIILYVKRIFSGVIKYIDSVLLKR